MTIWSTDTLLIMRRLIGYMHLKPGHLYYSNLAIIASMYSYVCTYQLAALIEITGCSD